jgi:DNA-directed RNA polymerase III subunit RPC7
MSFRGGRGGRRGGGLGGRAGPLTEEERNATHYSFPTDTYPKVNVPLAAKPTRAERLAASHYLAFRTEVREGPLFTGNLGAGKRAGAADSNSTKQAHQNKKQVIIMEVGFEGLDDGIKRYTDRYHKKRKVGRSIDDHPYVLDFFPKELYPAMGIKEPASADSNEITANDGRKRKFVAKRLDVAKFTESLRKTEMPTSIDELLQLEADSNGVLDADARARAIESIKAAQKDGTISNKDANPKDDEEENKSESDMEDDMEDDFDEDDDDDYNAEKYFDDGEGGDDDDGNDEAAY